MRDFFKSRSFKVLAGVVLVLLGVVLFTAATGRSFLSSLMGFVTTPVQQISSQAAGAAGAVGPSGKTIEELADKLGFTGDAKETFLATVDRYNELYDKQNDEDFGKPAYRLSAIRTAPFYGCWLGASLLTTEQGIAINEKGQALDNNNQPMEGLYITGDMSGSFFANNYPCLMAGVAMGRTLTFAMKAVKQMAGLDNA